MNTSNTSATSPVDQTNVPQDDAPATTLQEFEQQTSLIVKKATDLMASPLVTEGYAMGGHPAELAYVHLNTMSASRIKKVYPMANLQDPLFARLQAEAKMIVAKCMNLKYKCRKERKSYDHLRDIDRQVRQMCLEMYDKYREELVKLSGPSNG